VKNQTQKGLSYLRLAEIYFKIKADYLKSKKYYDSTLTSLPVNYPGDLAVKKISINLSYLADRLQIITREDTLQALARMDEKTRAAVINKMVEDNTLQQKAAAAARTTAAVAAISGGPRSGRAAAGGTFYFDNASAVSQGYNDFKRVWGNRPLEDDWRRSSKGAADASTATASPAQTSTDPDAPVGPSKPGKNVASASNFRKDLIDALPLTPVLLDASNLRVYNAYIELGDFYRDILDDKKEAIDVFETILRRFPRDPNKPAIYYNLYRLYSDVDPGKSDFYKNRLLKEFPETPFARIIIDPDFARKLEDQNAEFTNAYNHVFNFYADKKYKDVITRVPVLLKQYPDNKFAAQLYYLQTIAQGHDEKVGPFSDSLQQLIKLYPNDKLIVPLAKQHLAYISANENEMLARKVVIGDVDPNEVPFTLAQENKEKTNYRKILKPYIFTKTPEERLPEKKKEEPVKKPVEIVKAAPKIDSAKVDKQAVIPKITPKKDAVKAVAKPVIPQIIPKKDSVKTIAQVNPPKSISKIDTNKTVAPKNNPPMDTAKAIVQTAPPKPQPADSAKTIANVDTAKTSPALLSSQSARDSISVKVVVPSIFSKQDSTDYYFVVNVSSGTTNLASSRFGIGQFDRTNYAGNGIKHQLKQVGENDQVIYVGLFSSLDKVKKYARDIVPLLPDIMKVPKAKYSFFIITKENLDKLADQKTLDSYIDYYQNNY
jgi:tetratricopeptide (TPR) repeat protein